MDDLVTHITTEIRESYALWNPEYIDVRDWELYIPVSPGVGVKAYTVSGDEYYSVQTVINTVGDCELADEDILGLLQGSFASELPYIEKYDMETMERTSLTLTVTYEDVAEATDTVFVSTSWGDGEIGVNVPSKIGNQEEYAKRAVEKMLRDSTNQVLREVSDADLNNPELTIV